MGVVKKSGNANALWERRHARLAQRASARTWRRTGTLRYDQRGPANGCDVKRARAQSSGARTGRSRSATARDHGDRWRKENERRRRPYVVASLAADDERPAETRSSRARQIPATRNNTVMMTCAHKTKPNISTRPRRIRRCGLDCAPIACNSRLRVRNQNVKWREGKVENKQVRLET